MRMMIYCKPNPSQNQGISVIIPTAEFDPLFADDGVPFQTKMFDYIRREFADLLEQRPNLLPFDQSSSTLTIQRDPQATIRKVA